jgi:hypothetical protein
MKWTGLYSTDWNNPSNWVEQKSINDYPYESPALWAPTACVSVTIPSEAPLYPELKGTSFTAICNNITMEDRAMLKNPHALDYDSAYVEIKLKPSEKDRFIMWSAPLLSMYSGDYHFANNGWGDVYMNLFQHKNPAGGSAQANQFTATFGELNEPLELGKAFNLKVIPTTMTRDSVFRFPKTQDKYIASNGVTEYPTSRTNPNKFITDGHALSVDTTFNLPVDGDNNWHLIQVVNPYFACLNVAKFLEKNNDKLSTSGYLIWDGELTNSFMAVKFLNDGMRYFFSGTPLPVSPSNPELIPPLQSFFVAKKTDVPVTELKMSPNWTTTQRFTYTLRSSETETGVLRIKATQGNKTSYTALRYDPSANSLYNRDEDVPAIFYDRIPLTLYTLTPDREALSINVNGDFALNNTDLGLRLTEPGKVTLEFTGLETFGHEVWLIDKERTAEIDLKRNPTYTFAAATTTATEINDRFSLRMNFTGTGLATETAISSPIAEGWQLSAADGYIHVKSFSGDLSGLQVYNLAGMLVYRSDEKAAQYRVKAEGSHTYIVKVRTGNASSVKKIILR